VRLPALAHHRGRLCAPLSTEVCPLLSLSS
jgi:hypothetical protein